jgi:hypothetical protein
MQKLYTITFEWNGQLTESDRMPWHRLKTAIRWYVMRHKLPEHVKLRNKVQRLCRRGTRQSPFSLHLSDGTLVTVKRYYPKTY